MKDPQKKKKRERGRERMETEGVVQAVKHLLHKCRALSSNSNATKYQTKQRKKL
jgi:hypothetical protein